MVALLISNVSLKLDNANTVARNEIYNCFTFLIRIESFEDSAMDEYSIDSLDRYVVVH